MNEWSNWLKIPLALILFVVAIFFVSLFTGLPLEGWFSLQGLKVICEGLIDILGVKK